MFESSVRSCWMLCLLLIAPKVCTAGQIDPERVCQFIISGRFLSSEPSFSVIFSSHPVVDSRGRPISRIKLSELAKMKSSPDRLIIKFYGKKVSKSGRLDYFFGPKLDPDQPWSNGKDFHWEDWAKYSTDIWDNICIVPTPPLRVKSGAIAEIRDITIRLNGQLLFDSRKKDSYPNKKPIRVALSQPSAKLVRGSISVINLGRVMHKFRDDYYELNRNPVLSLAYSDLGQMDRSKYARRGRNWCSEFCSYLYLNNGIEAPDPNKSDVNWLVMRRHFEKNKGKIYSAREVASWTDRQKIERIKPGSFVSIMTSEDGATHSLMFTTWVKEKGKPISTYTGISGNNRKMVWAHSPLELPDESRTAKMTDGELDEYDRKVYFAVPEM